MKAQGTIELACEPTAGAKLGQGATRLCSGTTYRPLPAQGATQSRSTSTYCPLVGQGATEYLVLLAVVLIVALVSVALLGFFPGMASDAQIEQSQMYWQSASPVSVIETGASYLSSSYSFMYLRVRNSGAYPVRIVALLGGDTKSGRLPQVYSNILSTTYNISEVFYLAPGEEKFFGYYVPFGLPYDREFKVYVGDSASATNNLQAAKTICSAAGQGTIVINNFGFEHVLYVDGQQITKKQFGKPLIIKCK
jgi:hypothetical protein